MKLNAVYFTPEDWICFRESTVFQSGGNAKTGLAKIEAFFGAVKTALIKKSGENPLNLSSEMREIVGDSDNPGSLRIWGPFVFKRENSGIKHFFPAPNGIYRVKEDSELEFMMPHYKVEAEINGRQLKLPWIPSSIEGIDTFDGSLIELKEIKNFQSARPFSVMESKSIGEKLYRVESKVGIALEKGRKNAEESMLYTLSYYRFNPGAGFFVFADDNTVKILAGISNVFIGSKTRSATVEFGTIETDVFDRRMGSKQALCLLTPAVFSNGALPSDMKIAGCDIESANIQRKIAVSGWDLVKQQPKPIKHYIAPGTVYYLKGDFGYPQSVSSDSQELGYGKYFTIDWDYIGRE
ncbi:MAG TPA: type III-B CRISPR module-associated protein Cmr3 [Mesotoga infera]|jgi:CRISPR-associated protein Cmr3|nr:type III-B CRISPR module-associated protein Cmr3 [Mesotoga infera]HRR45424.1 type III-B CRISPR module-associated protein Cmr3 [Mesotoga sp.]HRV03225.1 type III-B CRISPR module-associated protein Cmr3 [Mesotoga sp.]